ncbi:hypothetical protein NMT12_190019 [metagenome]
MRILCSKCSERYELAVRDEYLIKMGLIPYYKPLYCEDCQK